MVIKNNLPICVFLSINILLFSACNSINSVQDLQKYISVDKNGLSKTQKIGNIELKMTYCPSDILLAQELNSSTDKALLDSLKNKYNKYYYFLLSMSADGKEVETYNSIPNGTFGERIQILSFGMGDYLTMTTNHRDTIPIVDYMNQRTYGIGKSTDLLFVYERTKILESKDITFKLEDFGLDIGDNKFSFKVDKIKSVPAIF